MFNLKFHVMKNLVRSLPFLLFSWISLFLIVFVFSSFTLFSDASIVEILISNIGIKLAFFANLVFLSFKRIWILEVYGLNFNYFFFGFASLAFVILFVSGIVNGEFLKFVEFGIISFCSIISSLITIRLNYFISRRKFSATCCF